MIYLLWFLGALLVSTVGLFVLFVIVVRLQTFVEKRPRWVKTAIVLNWAPVLALAVAWDYAYQHTWADLIFWEVAPKGEKMLTWRLQRWKATGAKVGGWRYHRAILICRLVEWVKPGHCK